MAKIIVFGKNGQLGRALQDVLGEAAYYSSSECDVTNHAEVAHVFASHPEVRFVINATAYTKVDLAETEQEQAFLVNEKAVELLASKTKQVGATLIHISTDYVFDGAAIKPYVPTDTPSPLSAYGASKLAGELAVQSTCANYYIVRTTWLYGDGNNFVKTMLRIGQKHSEVTVVADQFGLPTFAKDLANFCRFLVETQPCYGIYHFSNGGEPISWADFAEAIFSLAKIDCKVKRVSTSEYIAANPNIIAPRPQYSALSRLGNMIDPSKDRLNFYERGWYAALAEYLHDLGLIT